jgi:ribonuclease HI
MFMKLHIYTDGGARGNPGPAATGIVIKDEAGITVSAFGEYLGKQTNNYAEYMAIISGLKKAKELGATEVDCVADSKLVVEQLNRRWKVKEPTLQKLFIEAWNLMQQFKRVRISHVLRHKNKEADAEVNKILDNKAY